MSKQLSKKTFHSAADFPQENPEVAIEANRCCATFLYRFFNDSVYNMFRIPIERIVMFNNPLIICKNE